ncbi:MAG: hypothetical protein JW891_08845 [Candidatus Lokiarchaeota archaeon]|nr:hypothetical protein [Candidatus Lokiarchaeota archaeon]
MFKAKKILKINVLLIVIFLLADIPLSLVLVYLENIPPFLALFFEYVECGRSIFIPFFPKINILGFLPNAEEITKFTFGHLFDIIIVANLILLVETIIYHYYIKRKVNNKKIQKLIGFQICLEDFIDNPSHEFYPDMENLESKEDIIQVYFKNSANSYLYDKELDSNEIHLVTKKEKSNFLIPRIFLKFHKKCDIGLSSLNFKPYSPEKISILYSFSKAFLVNCTPSYPCIQIREVEQ